MKTYHYIFMTAKIIILSLLVIGKFKLLTNTHHLETIMEDLFSVCCHNGYLYFLAMV